MAALTIDTSTRDQETVHDSLPGRFGLIGQQKSDRLVSATEQRDLAWRQYSQAIDDREDGKICAETVAAFQRVYDIAEAWRDFVLAGERYVESTALLLNGEITAQEQAAIWNDYMTAGNTFRSM